MKYGTGYGIIAMDDPVAIRDFAQTLDSSGFDFVTTAGHLLSSEMGRFPDRPAPTYVGPYYDPFVLFGYLAGVTQRLRFRTGILILPLYETAVVAKQSAELSQLSGGRFDLGVGISWNPAEYEAVRQDIGTRGRRMEEQIEVLRLFWTQPYVSFKGRWHTIDRVGLNRLPASPPPIWIGSGSDDQRLRRLARVADGWLPQGDPSEAMPRLHEYLAEAGRDPASFGVTMRVVAGPEGPSGWVAAARRAQEVGATHLTIGAPPDLAPKEALDRMVTARQVLADELGG